MESIGVSARLCEHSLFDLSQHCTDEVVSSVQLIVAGARSRQSRAVYDLFVNPTIDIYRVIVDGLDSQNWAVTI